MAQIPDSAFLAQVRRMEAVGFRSFPSTTTYFDGTWAIRLTAGHPAKRLNSVNPLDPFDHASLVKRLEMARQRFESFGRPLIVRQSPLAPPELVFLIDELGWESFEESIVMVADLADLDFSSQMDYLPIKDTGRWVDCYLQSSRESLELKPGLVEVISSIEAETGLFIHQKNNETIAAIRCVSDNKVAGLFDLVTARPYRRQGHARELVGSAMKWALLNGAQVAWLQVVADNKEALHLYQDMGFRELYRYVYRRPPKPTGISGSLET